MKGTTLFPRVVAAAALAALVAAFGACDKSIKYDTNLLKNSSFEEVGGDGIPRGWKLVLFRGAPEEPGVEYGSDTLATDGKRSFMFKADPGTRRFYMLQQEIKLVGASQVRIRGWILADGVRMKPNQSSMCNFLVTFFDKDHNRFQVERQADRRTPPRGGTHPWEEQVYTFDVPDGTHYIAFSAILGMNGQAWFDHVSLEIPNPVPWETQTTKNYVFHWLPGHPMPAQAPEAQQARFDDYATRLGIKSDVVINYYFYPDTTTIQQMIGIKGIMYTNWDDYEFHTVYPNDDHEVVHFITDSVGRPPRVIAEGTVFWLQDSWGEKSLDEQISSVVKSHMVTKFTELFEQENVQRADPTAAMTTATAFVKFINFRWGQQGLIEFYRAANGMNTYMPISKAFETSFGIPLDKAEQDFHQWLIKNYN